MLQLSVEDDDMHVLSWIWFNPYNIVQNGMEYKFIQSQSVSLPRTR